MKNKGFLKVKKNLVVIVVFIMLATIVIKSIDKAVECYDKNSLINQKREENAEKKEGGPKREEKKPSSVIVSRLDKIISDESKKSKKYRNYYGYSKRFYL